MDVAKSLLDDSIKAIRMLENKNELGAAIEIKEIVNGISIDDFGKDDLPRLFALVRRLRNVLCKHSHLMRIN